MQLWLQSNVVGYLSGPCEWLCIQSSPSNFYWQHLEHTLCSVASTIPKALLISWQKHVRQYSILYLEPKLKNKIYLGLPFLAFKYNLYKLEEVKKHYGDPCSKVLRKIFIEVSLNNGLHIYDPDVEN